MSFWEPCWHLQKATEVILKRSHATTVFTPHCGAKLSLHAQIEKWEVNDTGLRNSSHWHFFFLVWFFADSPKLGFRASRASSVTKRVFGKRMKILDLQMDTKIQYRIAFIQEYGLVISSVMFQQSYFHLTILTLTNVILIWFTWSVGLKKYNLFFLQLVLGK